jgi:NAD(P)-dependent dehydrogenase (short-subunit alcohol dehydrogenase family)
MKDDLSGRVVVVTGASSGLGRHFSLVLAAHGAHVVAIARREAKLKELTEEITSQGGTASYVSADLGDRQSIRRAFAQIVARHGHVDVLVNNAGVGPVRPALEHTDADWDDTFATNLTGPWEMCRLFAAHCAGRGVGGSIVNVASAAALVPIPDTAAYSTSKAALVHLTRQLAREWAPLGVRVNCLCPGHFLTELNAEFLHDESFRDKVAARVPLGRLGVYSDLDAPLLLLASEGSAYVTGAVLPVDGGQALRNP